MEQGLVETAQLLGVGCGVPSSQGGIDPTGDKFYSPNGTLLWNTNMEGEPNRVFVFSPTGNQSYNSIVKSYADKKDSGGLLTRMRQVSTEWSFIADANSNNVYASPPRGFASTSLMIFSIMGEGFASGYSKAPYANSQQGLYEHYNSLNSLSIARDYWLPSFSTSTFQKWW